jgi:hypothetical protein
MSVLQIYNIKKKDDKYVKHGKNNLAIRIFETKVTVYVSNHKENIEVGINHLFTFDLKWILQDFNEILWYLKER